MGAEQEYMLTIRALRERISRDDLTGLYNKTYLIQNLEQRVAQNEPFAVFAFDLDNFKVVNDTFGHQTGDTLLQAWALFFKSHFKRRDDVMSLVEREPVDGEKGIVARTGGDEFIGVISTISSEQWNEERRPTDPVEYMEHEMAYLRSSAQTFKNRIPNIPRLEALSAVDMDLSIGYATWSPEKPADIMELLRQADQAMYADKRAHGGNR